jgi:hypothetical protein
MGITKDCISAPLEAGSSLQDSKKLPSQLGQALDYVSDRLLRKHVHLTLIVVKQDLPSTSIPSSPKSPTPSRSSSRSSFSRVHLPSLPGSPRSTKSSASRSSSVSSQSTSSFPSLSRRSTATQEPDPYGLSLHYTSTLPTKTSQLLDESIAKATKKYSLGSGWLIPPYSSTSSLSLSKSASGPKLTSDLIRHSLHQHDIIYGSESLTLLAVDRIYTFKLALSDYSKTFMPAPSPKYNPLSREEKLKQRNQAKIRALDELRLLVLFHKNRPISQSYLLRSYDHLSISVPALRSVNEAYKAFFHADGVDIDAVRPLITSSPLLRSPSGKTISSAMVQDMTMKSGMHQIDMGPYYRAPTTPTRYEQVTPITRDEWDTLMWGRANVGRVEAC